MTPLRKVCVQSDVEIIGIYEFLDVPRVGELVSVPWPNENDCRKFAVEEVIHFAAGMKSVDPESGAVSLFDEPMALIRVQEIG